MGRVTRMMLHDEPVSGSESAEVLQEDARRHVSQALCDRRRLLNGIVVTRVHGSAQTPEFERFFKRCTFEVQRCPLVKCRKPHSGSEVSPCSKASEHAKRRGKRNLWQHALHGENKPLTSTITEPGQHRPHSENTKMVQRSKTPRPRGNRASVDRSGCASVGTRPTCVALLEPCRVCEPP